MYTPDKTLTREEQPGQEQLLHKEYLHIQNMEIIMFFGKACHEEQCTEHHPREARKEMETRTTGVKRNFHREIRHEDLRDRSGTSGITKGSSRCNKGKFAD
jgi:hypothetical protein